MKTKKYCFNWEYILLFLLIACKNEETNLKMELSPLPPAAALSSSLPPQQAPLPPAPNGLVLKQGYFSGQEGVQLFYRMVGSGKDTLVFVHGGPIGIEDAALDLERIAERGYTFICFDERGGARSELVRDSSKLGMNNFVADLEALRIHFKLKKLLLAGDSWGAGVCSFYTMQHPNNVERLALLSPMFTTDADNKQRFDKIYTFLGKEKSAKLQELGIAWSKAKNEELPALWRAIDSIYMPVYVTDASHLNRGRGCIYTYSPLALRNADNELKYSFGSLGEGFDFREQLKQIIVPTVVIEGDKTIVPKESTLQYIYAIKNSKMVWIPNAGHMFWLDQPKAAVDALDDFFRLK